ncbi:ABC transporter ATP-binding protein [Arthrobacter pascens]|uniref:ABC transporter ATP-binding protein n=1 Tax=Arthrobacter pascens TaxID=1677 RepID=UPI001F097977|nr:ABC transporter ATP-binding protein [Arthrobacter pascens]
MSRQEMSGRNTSGQNAARTTLCAAIEGFTFHGGSGPALRGVEIEITPGSLTAVLGGSGSGKSTLGRLLAAWLAGGRDGVLRGTLQLAAGGRQGEGCPLVFSGTGDDPRIDSAAWADHVGYVPQDAAAMLSAVRGTVEEELAFGLENRGTARSEMTRIVAETARRTGLTALLERDPATLSGGELRRLAIGCAIVTGPGVLILDEPLASLDPAGERTVMELVRDVRGRGAAVVVLSQHADGLTRQATHWLVLEDGAATAAGPPDRLLAGGSLASSGVVVGGPPVLPAAGAGSRPVAAAAPAAASGPAPAPGLPPALQLEGVSFGFDANDPGSPLLLKNINLDVRPGEIVAVTGPNGAGKSTLLRLFNGLLRPLRGNVRVAGKGIAGVPTGVVAERLGLLFQHPHDQLFERTVQREVIFGLERLFGQHASAKAAAALAEVGLDASGGVHPHELSGSGQRLLALATVLAREPAVLALDEPTVALDAHGLDRLTAAITAAAGRGAAVVLVTHDLAFARAHAHRTVELKDGALVGC